MSVSMMMMMMMMIQTGKAHESAGKRDILSHKVCQQKLERLSRKKEAKNCTTERTPGVPKALITVDLDTPWCFNA